MYPKRLHKNAISEPDYPVVHTKYGTLRGTWADDCFIFRGIDYAKARRFHAPEEPDCWEGIRPAVTYGPVPNEISTRIPPDAFTEPHFWYPQSEQCQNLNIWTPTIEREAKLPVLVWIHGGGQEHGSAIEIMAYDGEELAVWGRVVVVSVNHRLNVLGYLDLSCFGEEYTDSGYAGMLDLIASLRWIRDNIAGFGGDPENVMLFGQSGGGFKILQLMQMPEADGLFHKVSIHSGCGRDTLFTHENAAEVAGDMVDALGLDAAHIREIETIPWYRIAKAVNVTYDRFMERTGTRLQWTPPVDGMRYLGNPFMTLADFPKDSTVRNRSELYKAVFGKQNRTPAGTDARRETAEGQIHIQFRRQTAHIPMLAGSVLGEFTSSAHQENAVGDIDGWDLYTATSQLLEQYGEHANQVIEEYRSTYPDKTIGHALFVDVFMRRPHMDLCRMRAGADFAPVWNWLLALDMPCYGGTTPWHNSDEAYFFHHAEFFESEYIPGISERLQDKMAGALVAFAYTGDPNGKTEDGENAVSDRSGLPAAVREACASLPDWPEVTEASLPTMVFDRESEVRIDHDAHLTTLVQEAGVLGPGGKGPARMYGGGPRAER